jgi:hypothetical protein
VALLIDQQSRLADAALGPLGNAKRYMADRLIGNAFTRAKLEGENGRRLDQGRQLPHAPVSKHDRGPELGSGK